MPGKRSRRSKEELAAQFKQLFWLARKGHRPSERTQGNSHQAHLAAVKFARNQRWPWAEALVEASRLSSTARNDEAERILAECEQSVPSEWRCILEFLRGATHQAAGAHDAALAAYHRALDDPNFDVPGRAWYNIGIVLASKGEHEAAIAASRKALDDPNFDSPARAWNNIGASFAERDEIDEAINAYRKALAGPAIDTSAAGTNLGIVLRIKGDIDGAIDAFREALKNPNLREAGKTWIHLGSALSAKGKTDEAIAAFRNALRDSKLKNPGSAWVNLAGAYNAKGNLRQAEAAFKKALASRDPTGSDHARARLGLQVLKAKIESTALSPDDRALADAKPDADEVENGIIAAIKEAGDTQYEKYISKPDSDRDNTLSILRGWSSAVTLLEGSERRWRGGGYFLKWRGYGIVLDPGFDFLRNFHDASYHGREIHAVLVSHNHPDHNSDLKDIDDLRYELFKRLTTGGGSGCQPYVLLWDQDTDGATTFGYEKPQHQHEPVVMPSGFPQPINLPDHAARVPVRVTPFKVNHGNDVPHAMGMVLELLDKEGEPVVRIGYTGDTAYFEDLHRHLGKCDILIAHISQPSIDELNDASKLKDDHLGYRGTLRLLKECQPKLALIGEFWAGFADLRIPLVKGLRQRSGVSAVLPTGIAMNLRLPSLEIECTECGSATSFALVKVAPPADSFGSLAYLCPNCMLG